MPRKTFVSGEILTASDVNTFLGDQAVMVFDDSAARGSAIPTPSEGMVTYLSDVNRVEVYTGAAFVPVPVGAGSVLQVVQASTSTEVTIASTTYTDTGLSATITPRATSSKILVVVSQNMGIETATSLALRFGGLRLLRDATDVHTNATFALIRSSFQSGNPNTVQGMGSLVFEDSPNTSSAVTYKTQGQVNDTASSSLVRAQYSSQPSTITLLEVAG
jgi:hypothetical protein